MKTHLLIKWLLMLSYLLLPLWLVEASAVESAPVADSCIECKTGVRGASSSGGDIGNIVIAAYAENNKSSKFVQKVSNFMCRSIQDMTSGNINKVRSVLKKRICKHKGLINEKQNQCANQVVVDFWNENQQHFICKKERNEKLDRDRQQILKAALDTKKGGVVFNKFLGSYLKEGYRFDFNHIEFINGQCETITDYLELIKDKPKYKYDKSQIVGIIDTLEAYDAKRCRELPPETVRGARRAAGL